MGVYALYKLCIYVFTMYLAFLLRLLATGEVAAKSTRQMNVLERLTSTSLLLFTVNILKLYYDPYYMPDGVKRIIHFASVIVYMQFMNSNIHIHMSMNMYTAQGDLRVYQIVFTRAYIGMNLSANCFVA